MVVIILQKVLHNYQRMSLVQWRSQGGARGAMAPPKLCVNVFFRNEFLKISRSGENVNTMFPNEGDLSDRDLLLPAKKFLPLIVIPPPPPTEFGGLMGIPNNFCYYPPPTESGRSAEIMEKWPPPNKNPGYAVALVVAPTGVTPQ